MPRAKTNKHDHKILVERLALAVGVFQPLTTIPQIVQIEQTHNVVGVSLVTWYLSAFSGLIFLAYGFVHKLRPVIVTQIMWFILQMIVVVQILLYK